ncbi:MAG: HlyD family secretion protein [Pseudomonadales bacterium]|nr:HlyD family secretion protein [Pseudomonadales bacterium]
MELFRPEAVSYRINRKRTQAMLQKSSAYPALVWSLCSLLVILVVLMSSLDYRETQSARGRLIAHEAEQQLVAPETALVHELNFSLGDKVQAGDVVATLSRRFFGADGESLSSQQQKYIHLKIQNLREEQHLLEEAHQRYTVNVGIEIEQLRKQLTFAMDGIAALEEQLDISDSLLQKTHTLMSSGSLPEAQYREQEFERLNLVRLIQTAKQTQQQSQSEIVRLENQLATAEFQYELNLSKVRANEIDLMHQLSLNEQQEQLSVLALRDGIVSTIAVAEGESVSAGQPLVYLQPDGRALLAEIYVPSTVVAKLVPGQELMLRYDAFDFRSYGRYSAEIESIGRSPLDPREHRIPISNSPEPLFPVLAILDQHFVEGADVFPLQSGLLLGADFITAEMSLIEFIFKPLLGLRGKVF